MFTRVGCWCMAAIGRPSSSETPARVAMIGGVRGTIYRTSPGAESLPRIYLPRHMFRAKSGMRIHMGASRNDTMESARQQAPQAMPDTRTPLPAPSLIPSVYLTASLVLIP